MLSNFCFISSISAVFFLVVLNTCSKTEVLFSFFEIKHVALLSLHVVYAAVQVLLAASYVRARLLPLVNGERIEKINRRKDSIITLFLRLFLSQIGAGPTAFIKYSLCCSAVYR